MMSALANICLHSTLFRYAGEAEALGNEGLKRLQTLAGRTLRVRSAGSACVSNDAHNVALLWRFQTCRSIKSWPASGLSTGD